MSTVLKLISNINSVTNYKLDGRAICRGAAKLSQPKNAQIKKCKINNTDIQICKCTDIQICKCTTAPAIHWLLKTLVCCHLFKQILIHRLQNYLQTSLPKVLIDCKIGTTDSKCALFSKIA